MRRLSIPKTKAARRARKTKMQKALRYCVLRIVPNKPVELIAHFPDTEAGKKAAWERRGTLPDHFVVWIDRTLVTFWESSDAA